MRDVFFSEKKAFLSFLQNDGTGPPEHLSSCNAYGFGSTPHAASCARVFSVL